MTPAELLLAAADRIDQTRADTTPGPWAFRYEAGGYVTAEYDDVCEVSHDGSGAWIALLNPQTGEHIADLLRGAAEDIESRGGVLMRPIERQALALARAILGGDR